jgi:hypothetical protein
MGCNGLHCEGCSHHRGGFAAGFGALVLLTAVLVYAAHRHAINHAASVAGDVALIALVSAAGIALAVALALTGLRIRRTVAAHRQARQLAAPPRVHVLPAARPAGQPAIGNRPRAAWPLLPGWAPGTHTLTRGDGDERRPR